MNHFTSFFPRPKFFIWLGLIAAALAVGAVELRGQTPPKPANPFQKASFEKKKTCTVPGGGEVTALVKNGVELSVNEDFDCDGVPDAYDNCVGMPNPDQADTNHNGIGDVCEAAVTINANPAAHHPQTTAHKPSPPHKRLRQLAKKRRRR